VEALPLSKPVVAAVVLLPVVVLLGVWLVRLAATPPASWRRRALRHAAVGASLVVPGAVAAGLIDGKGTGVLDFLLWGVLAGVFFLTTRLDLDESEPDSDTRWLIDVSAAAFAAVTVFFTFVSSGYVFIPSTCFVVVAWRYVRLRRRRRQSRTFGHTTS
jgi:hypothetical protein